MASSSVTDFLYAFIRRKWKTGFSFATSSPTPTQSITALNMVAIRNTVESAPCNS